jgi:hypothetical protein
MAKHRWNVNERGTGKCAHCKTRVKLVKEPKLRGEGKKLVREYTVPGQPSQHVLPECIEK